MMLHLTQTGTCLQGAPEQHLALPLVILMAQQLQVIASDQETTSLMRTAELYDRCQETLHLLIC